MADTRNRAFRGARRKGYLAQKAGKPRNSCPYPDHRGGANGGTITWSRAFMSYWYEGWDLAARGKPLPCGLYEMRHHTLEGDSTPMFSAFTPAGHYIGSEGTAKFLCDKKGIAPEIREGQDRTCSIGFCEKEQKWYGWSHRAIYGFGIGSAVKKGDCAYVASSPEELIEDHVNFFADIYEDDPERWQQARADLQAECSIAVDRTGIYIGRGIETGDARFQPVGRGAWVAETLEDARQMACDFAESVD